jgi:ParB-like chromosome segregation protein Spo0J
MTQDQEDDEASRDGGIPSFEEAVQERKERIAGLKKRGDGDRANLLAHCRKGNRCHLDDCAVCERRHQVAQSQVPESVLRGIVGSSYLRFVVHKIDVNAIKIIGPRRVPDEKKLRALKASIVLIDLQTPITIRFRNKKPELVTGLYRLLAMKELGADTIPCFEHYHEERESFFWQRSENIRAEPRVLERAEYIDEMRQAILHEGGQVAPPGGRQPKEAGIKKAAKALGLTREDVRRCKAIAGISAEAKAEARTLGLDDNEDALLGIAKLPASAQCAAVSAIVDGQRAARARLAPAAAAVADKKAAAKIQAIEGKITEKKEAIETLKEELSDDRDRLDKVRGDLVAACANSVLINGPSAQSVDGADIVTVRGGALSHEDEARFAAVVEAWNKARDLKAELANASPMVLERYIAMARSWVAQEHKTRESDESD